MNSTIVLKISVAFFIAFTSNSIWFLIANRSSNNVGIEVKEILLSAATCPVSCTDKDGKHCCTK
ncbi:hypothetical protein PN499_18230 [Kamptonema animale CS-326]|uniref:hypothetical protein n=1 Tax=Kamptonema animale TaxID=92934 RepID=UPI00232BEE66|nr:hypothetical protein [Kamptonema animale]MDB9513134.1 hypothetical protein [Kamptonema animale CS-326]